MMNMNYEHFGSTSLAQLEPMRQLVRDWVRVTGLPAYFTPGDIDWLAAVTRVRRKIPGLRRWFQPGGELIGFAWGWEGGFHLQSHPLHRAVEAGMIAWAEQARRKQEGSREMTIWCHSGDVSRIRLLERLEYHPDGEQYLLMSLRLEQGFPQPQLPEGCFIRTPAGADDQPARVALHNEVLHPGLSLEQYRRVTSLPEYRPDLDLVVFTASGEPAGFCLGRYDPACRHGHIQWIGVRSAFSGQGLAGALLLSMLRLLDHLGAVEAHTRVTAACPIRRHLFQKAGFAEVDRSGTWHRRLEAAGESPMI